MKKISPTTDLTSLNQQIFGNVKIGQGCILHPTCKIIAKTGQIQISENNIFEEGVIILNDELDTLTIGANNIFEVGSIIKNSIIGSNNLIEVRAFIDSNSRIENGNVIGVCVNTGPNLTLFSNQIIYGKPSSIRIIDNLQQRNQERHTKQIELLRKILSQFG
eukprot:TRINITY_DN8805_c0_g1_i1.p1 TRINITY_DN8805_c0_g1~~TRINITY_DN8805_c0_g1_i1.p1  ORF type:complete len:176 (-),score=69.65 TRINITY_DN8805_c0_g1_i1:77-562(-)